MTRKGASFGIIVLGIVAGTILYLSWGIYLSSEHSLCPACSRHLHSGTKTVGTVEGRTIAFCCPSCALTDHRQTGRIVNIAELSDYESGASFPSQGAYMVTGSNVNPCMSEHMLVGGDKQAGTIEFDRCMPSMIAFPNKNAAEVFARQHGGQVQRFEDLAAAYQR